MRQPSPWQGIHLAETSYLAPFGIFSDDGEGLILGRPGEPYKRSHGDGAHLVLTRFLGAPIALVVHDFRLKGGSYGASLADRLDYFFRHITGRELPLVTFLNSVGVRLTEGRQVFSPSFLLLRRYIEHAKRALSITVTMDRGLGLAAPIFATGHYRIAAAGSKIALTGPEVIKCFFQDGSDFDELADPKRMMDQSGLVSEVLSGKDHCLDRALLVLTLALGGEVKDHGDFPTVPLGGTSKRTQVMRDECLVQLGCRRHLLFPELPGALEVYLVERPDCHLGVFLSPPFATNNLADAATLRKYREALRFFAALKLPIISILDTVGFDPRVGEVDQDLIGLSVDVADRIISYPAPRMGVVLGRCYGGSTTLGFPPIFGAEKAVAIQGAQIGIMGQDILARLFASNQSLKAEWMEVAAQECPDMEDIVSQGAIHKVITLVELGKEVAGFLQDTGHGLTNLQRQKLFSKTEFIPLSLDSNSPTQNRGSHHGT